MPLHISLSSLINEGVCEKVLKKYRVLFVQTCIIVASEKLTCFFFRPHHEVTVKKPGLFSHSGRIAIPESETGCENVCKEVFMHLDNENFA